jgi:hypothetical protein
MKLYTVADSPESLAQNRGTEIIASGFEEARDKAESLGLPCKHRIGSSEGLYTITDGAETREMECESGAETELEGGFLE